MKLMRRVIEALVWAAPPSSSKNRLLNAFGHRIDPSVRIGPSMVWGVDHFRIGPGVIIGLCNVFRNLRRVELEDECIIESWNWISAHPIYQAIDDKAGTLFVGYRSKVGSRCYLDCSGTLIVREYAALGGHRCVVQTHEPDLAFDAQTVGRITVDAFSLVSTSTVLLKGAHLPPQSVLAAHSTLMSGLDTDSQRGLYAGSPARHKRTLPETGWFTRDAYRITDHRVDAEQGVLDADRHVERVD